MKYIFVHGLGQNASSWNKVIGEIGDPTDILCLELSEMIKGKSVTYDNLYKAFSEYCNGISEPINLCGLSLGAILALNYTIDNPSKVNSLILIGGQYKMPKFIIKLQNIVFRWLPKAMFEKIGFSKEDFIGLTKSMVGLDFTEQLSSIPCPTMVICGEKDRANKKATQHLEKYIVQAQLQILEDAGHEVNTQEPVKLAKVIKSFYKV